MKITYGLMLLLMCLFTGTDALAHDTCETVPIPTEPPPTVRVKF